jgi:hypothetical protein
MGSAVPPPDVSTCFVSALRYSAASSADELKHLVGPVHDLAAWPDTEARQHLFSAVEIPPAVQSASVWHNRVVDMSNVWLGGHASGDAPQATVIGPLRMGIRRQHALPPQSAGP